MGDGEVSGEQVSWKSRVNRETERERERGEGERGRESRSREKDVEGEIRFHFSSWISMPDSSSERNDGTKRWLGPPVATAPQPALRLGMQMRAAPSPLPPYRVPFRVFHPFDITTSPTSSKVSRYRRISASATRRGLRFFCFLSSRKETADKERNSYLLVVKKKKKKNGANSRII